MKNFRADLHIHTVLSPCGDLDMSPTAIVTMAREKGLDIIAVTDHNSTRHCRLAVELGKEAGLLVIPGVEVNTSEEVHTLAFFESVEKAEGFQNYLDFFLPDIMNDPDHFGEQLLVDRDERILGEEERSLYSGLKQSLDQVADTVHGLGGIMVLSHVDRNRNSVYSQLGFLPDNLQCDAIEISRSTDPFTFVALHPELRKHTVITNSDAHFIEDIGRKYSVFQMESACFGEIKMAVRNQNGRRVILP
jgi:PHP family Zn ribbon phosphoesterase